MVQERPRDTARPPAEGRRPGGGAIASLSGVGLLLLFMIQNTDRIRLDFVFWTFTWPLWLLTMVSAFLGALVWVGLGAMRRHRRRKERRHGPVRPAATCQALTPAKLRHQAAAANPAT